MEDHEGDRTDNTGRESKSKHADQESGSREREGGHRFTAEQAEKTTEIVGISAVQLMTGIKILWKEYAVSGAISLPTIPLKT